MRQDSDQLLLARELEDVDLLTSAIGSIKPAGKGLSARSTNGVELFYIQVKFTSQCIETVYHTVNLSRLSIQIILKIFNTRQLRLEFASCIFQSIKLLFRIPRTTIPLLYHLFVLGVFQFESFYLCIIGYRRRIIPRFQTLK